MAGATIFYPDVSHHQGTINWPAVKAAGHQRAMIKATGGQVDGLLRYTDPAFAANWQGAHAAGLECGAYHFARNNNAGADEWDWFIQAIRSAGGLRAGDWLCYDQEDVRVGAQTKAKQRTQEFINAAIAAGYSQGELYSGKWYLEPAGIRAVDIPAGWRKLWISDYAGGIEVPVGWSLSQIVARQMTDKRSIPGIPALTDYNQVLIDWRHNGPIQEADMDATELRREMERFFRIPKDATFDQINGQTDNSAAFAMLTALGQGAVNRDNAQNAAISALAQTATDTKSAVVALAGSVNTAGMSDAQVSQLAALLAPHLHIDEAELKNALKAAVTDLVTS